MTEPQSLPSWGCTAREAAEGFARLAEIMRECDRQNPGVALAIEARVRAASQPKWWQFWRRPVEWRDE